MATPRAGCVPGHPTRRFLDSRKRPPHPCSPLAGDGDHERMEQFRNQMFEGICEGFRKLYDPGDLWNTLAPRISNFGK